MPQRPGAHSGKPRRSHNAARTVSSGTLRESSVGHPNHCVCLQTRCGLRTGMRQPGIPLTGTNRASVASRTCWYVTLLPSTVEPRVATTLWCTRAQDPKEAASSQPQPQRRHPNPPRANANDACSAWSALSLTLTRVWDVLNKAGQCSWRAQSLRMAEGGGASGQPWGQHTRTCVDIYIHIWYMYACAHTFRCIHIYIYMYIYV